MNFVSNSQSLLLIMSGELLSKMSLFCANEFKDEKVKIIEAATGMDGIFAYNRHLPCLVIIEDTLADMMGSSVCAILKDAPNGGEATNIFLVGEHSSYLHNTNADYFFQKPVQFTTVGMVLKEFFSRRKLQLSAFIPEIEKAKRKQKADLPQKIETNRYSVNYVFSAFSELSGDGLDYWSGDDDNGLYGFLFDCSGHDILAYSQTSELRSMLKLSYRLYQSHMVASLSKVLHDINNDMFDVYSGDPTPTAAILFHIMFADNMLRYCSAGVPCFYADHGKGYTPVMTRNPLIGFEKGAHFEEHLLPLDGVQKFLFASDGLSELLFKKSDEKPPFNLAKHDDVSGIVIEIKRV